MTHHPEARPRDGRPPCQGAVTGPPHLGGLPCKVTTQTCPPRCPCLSDPLCSDLLPAVVKHSALPPPPEPTPALPATPVSTGTRWDTPAPQVLSSKVWGEGQMRQTLCLHWGRMQETPALSTSISELHRLSPQPFSLSLLCCTRIPAAQCSPSLLPSLSLLCSFSLSFSLGRG